MNKRKQYVPGDEQVKQKPQYIKPVDEATKLESIPEVEELESISSFEDTTVRNYTTKAAFISGLNSKELSLIEIKADGNCLFRAVAFQLYGSDFYHLQVRRKVVQFMENNVEKF